MARCQVIGALGLSFLATALARGGDVPPESALQFFEKKVRPLLVQRCYTCHSADTKPSGGLRVDDRHGLISGGNSGAAVVPGKPEAGLLLRRVTHRDPKQRMPKEGDPLSDAEIEAKFRRYARPYLRDGEAARLLEELGRLETLPNLDAFIAVCRRSAPSEIAHTARATE